MTRKDFINLKIGDKVKVVKDSVLNGAIGTIDTWCCQGDSRDGIFYMRVKFDGLFDTIAFYSSTDLELAEENAQHETILFDTPGHKEGVAQKGKCAEDIDLSKFKFNTTHIRELLLNPTLADAYKEYEKESKQFRIYDDSEESVKEAEENASKALKEYFDTFTKTSKSLDDTMKRIFSSDEFRNLGKELNKAYSDMVDNLSKVADPFRTIIEEMYETYTKKNADYGDSFTKGCDQIGMAYAVGRILDKYNRIENLLLHNSDMKPNYESVIDTLTDLATYCIMLRIYLESHGDKS